MDIYWLEATPWDYVTNQAVSVRVCSADLSLAVFFSGAEWLPVMDGGPTFSTSVFTGSFTGASDSTNGSVSLLTGAGEIDVWARFNWASRPVKIYGSTIDLSSTIAPALGSVNLMFEGHAESFDPDEATLFLRTILPVGLLASKSFAGTGGLEGPVGLASTKKPFSIGKHRNRPPVLINAGKLTFQCNASGRLEELIAVRERGIILDQPFVAQPSFAALDAATVPATEIHYHLASGCFRIGFTPQGDITADYRGAMTGQPYPATVPAIIRQALLWSGWDAGKIDETTLANVATALPHEAQIHDESGTDIAEALTSIMAGCGGYWDVDPFGIFYIGLFQMAATEDFSVGDEGLANYDLLETDFLPTRAMFWSNRVGFEQNPVVMTFAQTDAVGATPDQLALIKDAIDTADGKVDIYFQPAEPTGAAVGDLWYDTDSMFWYRFEPNGEWLLTQDAGIGIAITDAAGAQATADGKITSYSSEAQPSKPALGDLWVRPSEVPRVVRRWTGLIWDTVSTVGADINSNVYDGSGGAATVVPRSEIRTPLGTAAAIAGQGPAATAPRNDVYNDQVVIRPDGSLIGGGGGQVSYSGIGGKLLGLLDDLFFGSARLLEQAGGAIASLAGFKTSLGTSAGFFGQGALATLSSLANGSPFLSGFGLLSQRNYIKIGGPGIGTDSFALLTEGGTETSNGTVLTALGTAAGIFGQGTFATQSQARYGDQIANLPAAISPAGFFDGGRLLYASRVVYDDAGVVSAYRPEEAGSNRTETRTASAIFGQGFGATAARGLVDNSYVPVGVNAQIDSGFTRTSATWFLVGPSTPGYRLEFNRSDYSGARSVAYLWNPGTPAAGEICDAVGLGKWTGFPTSDMMKYCVPVKEGDVVATRVLAAPHRCIAQLYLLVFNKEGLLIAAPNASGGSPGGGGGGSNFGKPIEVVVALTDPASAYAQLMVRMACNGQANPYLFFSEPWIGKLASVNSPIPPYSPGPADPASDQTGTNTAAGFIGQGAFATQSNLDLANTSFFAASGRFAQSPQHGGAYFAASAVAFAAGETTESLRPQEAGGNRTETRTAAAFYNQGALATKSTISGDGDLSGQVANRLAPFPGDPNYLAAGRVAWGVGDTVENYKPEERGSNRTETRTAAAFSGQGGLATANLIRFGGPVPGYGGLVDESGSYYATDAGYQTGKGSAAGFFGQGGLATRNSVAYGDGYTFGFNYLATQTSVAFNTTTIRRADGSTSVSETLVVTELGVAAAFVGQGGLASKNQAGYSEIDVATLTSASDDAINGLFGGNFDVPISYVPNFGKDMAIKSGGTIYASISCGSGSTNASNTGVYNSLEILDAGSNGVLGSVKLPFHVGSALLTNYIVMIPNAWGTRTIRWRLATRGSAGSSPTSASNVQNPAITVQWKAL